MKVVILAGGLPSTIIEEDEKLPKPMAAIGGRPILWHIMKQYAYYGYNDFIICTGYKGEIIKDYFMNFYIYQSDITVDLQTNQVEVHRKKTEDWKISIVDTGQHSSIMKRIKKVEPYLQNESFLVTFGDCISNIHINEMVMQHERSKKTVTFAVARPTGRNEILPLNQMGQVDIAHKEIASKSAWVNASTMVAENEFFHYLDGDEDLLGIEMLKTLEKDNVVETYRHNGFWQPMETVRDKVALEAMWHSGKAIWKVW
ncbi:glucose-1-phosphate cytidylyltransferase [Lachnospiraceae bacterium ZAX-1]